MICSPTVMIRAEIIKNYFPHIVKTALKRKWLTLDYQTWLEVASNNKIGYISDVTSVYRVVSDSGSHATDITKSYLWDKCLLDIQLYYFKKYITPTKQGNTIFINRFKEMVFHMRKRMFLNYGWIAREQLLYLLSTNPRYYFFLVDSKIKRIRSIND